MSSLAPPPAASITPPRPKTFTGRHIALIAVTLIDVAYATLIFAGIGFGDDERLLPPQVSQIVVGALAAATVITSTIVICARFAERVETAVVVLSGLAARFTTELDRLRDDQLTGPRADLARDVARIKERLGMCEDDDPTKPIVYRMSPPQHIVGMASVYGGRADTAIDRAADRIAERAKTQFDAHVDARLADIAELAGNQSALNGRTNVVGLPRAR